MTVVIVRDMIDARTKRGFQRVFVADLDSLDDLPDLLQAIDDRFPREEMRNG